jgi:outer membrane scaffolding protein for murein synthesis (MipA/OmpV family)
MNLRGDTGRGLTLAAVLLAAQPAAAKDAPLWEYGFGAGAVAFQDYAGSQTTHVYPVPVVFLRYNGEFLKADRNGVRGLLLNQDRFELNFSGGGTVPANDDRLRAGMPSLKATFEIGPSLDLHLYKSADGGTKLDLRLPVREAFTLESHPRSLGLVYEPKLNLDLRDPAGLAGWNLGLWTGPLFYSRSYHDYFYSVDPQYATAQRPAYAAPGGAYSGSQLGMSWSKRYPRFWFGCYAHVDALAGASFLDSPLVRRSYDWSAGFGFAWIVGRSNTIVQVPD